MATNPADLMKQFDQTGVSDDPYPFPNAPQQSIAGPQEVPPQTWGQMAGDIGKAFVGSTEGQIGNAERWFGSTIDDYDLSQSWRKSGEAWNKSGQDWTGSMSPGGQQITNAPIFSNETWEHPLSKTLMGIGKGGLWNAAALIPGGGVVSGLARAGLGAALSYTGTYGEVVDSIKNVPDDQLQKSSPQYMELRKTYPEFQAKQMLADAAWDNMGAGSKAVIAGTGALAGEAGPLSAVGKTVTGAGGRTLAELAGGRIGQTAIAAGEAGGIQAGQYAGSAIPTRQALTSVGAPADTPSQIAWGTIEQGAVGAVVGGGLRTFKPVGGKNEANSRDTTGKGGQSGTKITEVPAGQADPAQAAALKSASQPGQQEFPFTYDQPNQPRLPPSPPPPPGAPPSTYDINQQHLPLNYWRPPSDTEAPIPPRPATGPPPVYAPRPVTQRNLPLEQPGQPPQRQGELPLQRPEPPVDQGTLPGMAPRQPLTQLGLPGMGADVVHAPGEDIPRPSEAAPKPPEPTSEPAPTPKKAKAPITKVSEPEPTPASSEVKGRIQEVADAHPTPENEGTSTLKERKAVQARAASIDSKITAEDKQAALGLPKEEAPVKAYITFANVLAHEKVPTDNNVRNFLNAEKQIRDHFGGEGEEPTGEPPTPTPKPGPKPVTKVSEPTEQPKAAKPRTGPQIIEAKKAGAAPKGLVSFAGLQKLLGKKAEPPVEEEPAAAPVNKAEAKRLAAIDKLTAKKATPAQIDRPIEPTKGEVPVTVLPSGMPAHTKIVPGEKAKAIVAKFGPKSEELAPKVATKVVKKLSDIKAALVEKQKAIEDAKAQVATNPTDAQKAAGNHQMGHPPASATQGQKVTVTSAAGKTGEAEGYILGTANNIPGTHLETLTHKSNTPGKFHVINEVDPNTSRFVRHIAVLGAMNHHEAYETFIGKMIKDHGLQTTMDKGLAAGVVEMSPEEFEHFKQTRNPNEPVYPSTEGKHPLGWVQKTAKSGRFQTQGSSTLKTALEEALRKVPNTPDYALYRKLAQQLIKYIPDVPIYYMSQEMLERHTPNANAMYAASMNHILIGKASAYPELTLLHEALHAATVHLYYNNRQFKVRVDKLLAEYLRELPSINETTTENIRLSGSPELLAELAKPFVQKQLARIQMSDKLAGELNMSAWAKGTRTLWNGIVNSFKDALRDMGMNIPGKDDASKFTLLDGLLRLNDEALLSRSAHARTDFANMIRASKQHNTDIFTEHNEQAHTQQDIVDTVHEAAASPHGVQDTFTERGGSISSRAEDLLDRAPRGIMKSVYYNHVVKLMGTDAFRMANEKFFGKLDENNPLRKYVEATLRRAVDFQERAKISNEFVAQMARIRGDIGHEETNKLSDILAKATAYRFDPRHAIGQGINDWLGAPAKRAEDNPNIFWKHKQALDKSGEITNDFNALHPKAKELFGKLIDDYRAKGRERAEIGVDQLLHTIDSEGPKLIEEPKLDPNDPSSRDKIEYAKYHNNFEQNWEKNKEGLRQRILDDNLTDKDKEWLANRGIDNVDDIHQLSVPKGPYVPLDHAGDWIINGRYKINAPANAKQINDNTFEFKTPQEMQEFLSKQPPNSRPYTVHYNDEGKTVPKWEKWQNKDGSVGFAKDKQAWRVEVNDKYYSGHDSLSAGNRRYKQLQESGAFSKISEPQMKQSGWYSQLEVSSPMFKKLISSVDRRTDYTEDQKKAVKQLLTDTAISSIEGNRIAKTLLPRKIVAGWDTDFIKTYNKYADMHNALMSRNKYAKELGDIRNELIKHAKDNEFNPGATERSGVLDELHERDNFFGSPDYVGGENTKFGRAVSPYLRKLSALSFLQNMASVGHLITHATHQIITADMVAAKYGGLGTIGEGTRLHSILGGAGFKNAWQSLAETKNVITKDSKGLNYVQGLIDKLETGHRYGAELKALIDKAIETGRVHPDQGFDISIYHMSSGKLDSVLSKLDRAARQTMGAVEAYNRVWAHSLAYVRAREAGENIEQATRSSFDMVSRSQGLLSRANMSPIMSKWYMRAPMQFRGWGMNMMLNISNSIYNAFKGETRAAKAEAWRRLAYLFGTTAALTGINGLPSDPMRIALALAGALGITNYNWGDAQNSMREKFAEMGGPGFATLAMDGALGSMGAFGFFGADRVGLASLAAFSEPATSSRGDIYAWLGEMVAGAPGQTAGRMVNGVNAIKNGDIAGGISNLIPVKIIDDWAKAWRGYTQGIPTKTGVPGMSPFSVGEAIMQGMGLTPARQERYREARTAELRAEQGSRDEVGQLLNAVGTSGPGADRFKAMQQISAYNLQHPEDRITPQDIQKAMRRATAPSALGKTINKRNQQRMQMLGYSYGL